MKTEIMKKIKLNYEIMLWLYFVMSAVTLGMYTVKDYNDDCGCHFFVEDKIVLAAWVGVGITIMLFLYRVICNLKLNNDIVIEIIANIIHCICVGVAISKIAYIKGRLDEKSINYPNTYSKIAMVFGIIVLIVMILLGIINIALYTKGLKVFEYPVNSEMVKSNYSIEYTRSKIESAFTVGIIIFTFLFMITSAITGILSGDEPGYMNPYYAFEKVMLAFIFPLLVFFFGMAKEWIAIGSTKKVIISTLVLAFGIYNGWFNVTRGYSLFTDGYTHEWIALKYELPIGGPVVAYFAILAIFAIVCAMKSERKNNKKMSA